ncbi:MAG: ribosome-associated protein [bacterium ADurb.Bin157]|jgi:ribosome-associated protein|nr:RNA-binding S4 domain-containing protein [Candidatus Riflebacteria bacterium]OQB47781.1 MAG: ribosome-associated protein [bacterium ADurb.Bin157]
MNNKEFELSEDYIELIKLLKFLGIAETGGQAKLMVENGIVKVDGETESRKRRKVRSGMTVTVSDEYTIKIK